MNYEEDSLLIKDYVDGNEYALEILIEKYKSRIYSFIFSKVFTTNSKSASKRRCSKYKSK